ncbi:hypothetical protein CC80DRAFT_588633 [Byssothecium circinans]|uniref:F-box domain-containing protein n=1 Tax=Byssothecium circinans TaxID=147558 RepID=A0A6A5UJT0_9PLEO|nr:hypothetical protein CC80DRAFT_588633 [Byssothecium circinans]
MEVDDFSLPPFPLPAELIQEILNQLVPDGHDAVEVKEFYHTFAAVIQTCRYLYRLAMPILYSGYTAAIERPISEFIAHSISRRIQVKRITVFPGNGLIYGDIFLGSTTSYATKHLEQCNVIKESSTLDWENLATSHPGAVDLAILLAQSPKLEDFGMASMPWSGYGLRGQIGRRDKTIPIFIIAMLEAIRRIPTLLSKDDHYGRLNTLEIDLGSSFSRDVIQLFRLPSLRTLNISNAASTTGEEAILPGIRGGELSGITHLRFSDSLLNWIDIVPLINSCKALSSFDYQFFEHSADRHWFTNIVSALFSQVDTLQQLHIGCDFELEPVEFYERVPGFEKFHQLQWLDIAFPVLMGKPAGEAGEIEDWEDYPTTRNVLPSKLRMLNLWVNPTTLPPASYDYMFLDLLSTENPPDVHLTYALSTDHYNFPIDLWELKNVFRQRGRSFSYTFDRFLIRNGDAKQYREFVMELSELGRKGVEVATQFDAFEEERTRGLQSDVMQQLGLDQHWLESEEGRRTMFKD